MKILAVLLLYLGLELLTNVESFTIVSPSLITSQSASASQLSTSQLSAATPASTLESINNIKSQIKHQISDTKRGLSTTTTTQKKQTIDNLIQELESNCPLSQPARSPLMGGKWIVDYTTSPPPSNGKLGPFVGFARQIIDLEDGTYVNYLSVPGDIEKEWLSAKLVATFVEWDGVLLKDDRIDDKDANNGDDDKNANDNIDDIDAIDIVDEEITNNETTNETPKQNDFFTSLQSIFSFSFDNKKDTTKTNTTPAKPDYGALNWKVDFQTLTITAFGIPLLTKKFDEGTSRIWKMSYLDDETRVGKLCVCIYIVCVYIYIYIYYIF